MSSIFSSQLRLPLLNNKSHEWWSESCSKNKKSNRNQDESNKSKILCQMYCSLNMAINDYPEEDIIEIKFLQELGKYYPSTGTWRGECFWHLALQERERERINFKRKHSRIKRGLLGPNLTTFFFLDCLSITLFLRYQVNSMVPEFFGLRWYK